MIINIPQPTVAIYFDSNNNFGPVRKTKEANKPITSRGRSTNGL